MRFKIAILISAAAIGWIKNGYGFDLNKELEYSANIYNLNANSVKAVAEIESGRRCGAKNGRAKGVMQVQKGAALSVGGPWPFKNCKEEIEAGVKYLGAAIRKGGDGCKGFTLYNAGINSKMHCSSYGRKVQRMKRKIEQEK